MPFRAALITSSTLVLAVLCLTAAPRAANGASEPRSVAGPTETLKDQIVRDYLGGKWDDAQQGIATAYKSLAQLTPAQRADIGYVRQTIAECRPAWWKQCKAGQKVTFRPMAFGKSIGAKYDPQAKTSVQVNYVNGNPSATVFWNASEMDDPSEAEHGFSKGELMDLNVWSTIGAAVSLGEVSMPTGRNLDAQEQLLITRYLDFRGTLTAAYYSTPRARRWGLRMDCDSFDPKHANIATILSREAVGALFMEEVVAHPKQYPSVQLPISLPAEGASVRLADHLKNWIQAHDLTLAEDQSLRAALKSFAFVNGLKVRQSGSVILPNKLVVALDPARDSAEAAKRDAWFIARLPAKP